MMRFSFTVLSLSTSFFTSLLISASAHAYTVSYKRTMTTGWSGNMVCFATDCTEASPQHDQLNCRHFSNIDFSIGQVTNEHASGYAWLSWLPDSASSIDFNRARSFTIDGEFDAVGFKNTGDFKNPLVGSNEHIPLKSARVDFLPPYGAEAHATIDLGGTQPLVIELECCQGGVCDTEKPVDPNPGPKVQPFEPPPQLCPAYPKEAFDRCMGIKSNIN